MDCSISKVLYRLHRTDLRIPCDALREESSDTPLAIRYCGSILKARYYSELFRVIMYLQ